MKKRTKKVLQGAVGVGVVLTGASVDANMVYAAENTMESQFSESQNELESELELQEVSEVSYDSLVDANDGITEGTSVFDSRPASETRQYVEASAAGQDYTAVVLADNGLGEKPEFERETTGTNVSYAGCVKGTHHMTQVSDTKESFKETHGTYTCYYKNNGEGKWTVTVTKPIWVWDGWFEGHFEETEVMTLNGQLFRCKGQAYAVRLESGDWYEFQGDGIVTYNDEIPHEHDGDENTLEYDVDHDNNTIIDIENWESQSTSLSESASTSLSESASTSLSESASTSLSESTSTSLSASTSTSLSESISTSLSESASTSLSESLSASESASAATSQTAVTPAGNGQQVVVDEEVPLAVIETEDETEMVTAEDEEVPLNKMDGEGTRLWWSWIPVIGAALSAREGARRNKDAQPETEEKK